MGYLRDYVLNTANAIVSADLAFQIANGMRYLHYGAPFHPIIHRNLHPLSILLKSGPEGRVLTKLHGFQHAKIMAPHETFGGQTVAPTNPGMWQGPEITGEDTSRTESDVYSYGMVVWHIFSRQLPFEGRRMTDPQIMKLTVMNKKRPAMPPGPDTPKLYDTLINKCWDEDFNKRPDFILIVKALRRKDVNIIDPPDYGRGPSVLRGKLEVEERSDWELDPNDLPVEGDMIISSNKQTSTVVVGKYSDGREVALWKPMNINTEKPTRKQFEDYMTVGKAISHDHVISCDGVLLLESIQLPLMEESVRQHLKGRRVKDTATNKKKEIHNGFGSMHDAQVTHIMKCVLKGLNYLHTTAGIPHRGLSTSNVILSKNGKARATHWSVRLCDYNLGALGIESHSHANRCLPPSDVQGKLRGDLFSCSVMFVEMLTGKDRKQKKSWASARTRVKQDSKKNLGSSQD
jgi:serine/threonine protein kinase